MRQKSARKIGNNKTSVTGYFNSIKNNRLIHCESSLEMDFAELLEFDAKVSEYQEQPIRLNLPSINSWYYPDFLVRYKYDSKLFQDQTDTYFEIKYQAELEKKEKYYSERFKEINSTLNSQGYRFKVLTEEHIRTHFLDNVKFLKNYKTTAQDPIICRIILDFLETVKTSNPNEVVAKFSGGFEKRAQALHNLWCLVADETIYMNLSSQISMTSELWIKQKDYDTRHQPWYGG